MKKLQTRREILNMLAMSPLYCGSLISFLARPARGFFNLTMFNKKANEIPSIGKSALFDLGSSSQLVRNYSTSGNRKTFTISFWVKRVTVSGNYQCLLISGSSALSQFGLRFTPEERLQLFNIETSYTANLETDAIYRDPAAWYHIVAAADTTQATPSERFKLFVNGVQVTQFTSETYPTQNSDLQFNNNVAHIIGRGYTSPSTPAYYLSGYLSDIKSVEGLALGPTSFGNFNSHGVWVPKVFSGIYGTLGFSLNSSINTGIDSSGGSNNFTPSNTSPSNDSPTSNLLVFNPLDFEYTYGSAGFSYSNGNRETQLLGISSSRVVNVFGTYLLPPTGKWYCEIYNHNPINLALGGYPSLQLGPIGTGASQGIEASQYIMLAIDQDNGKAWRGFNGTWNGTGNPSTGTDPDNTFNPSQGTLRVTHGAHTSFGGLSTRLTINFGHENFTYPIPTGFKKIIPANLPPVQYKRPRQYVNSTAYIGNGTSQSLTTLGHQSDLLIIKNRSQSTAWSIFDSARGSGNLLSNNSTNAESTAPTSLTSFDPSGFSLGNSTDVNQNTDNYVAYSFKKQPGVFDITNINNGSTGAQSFSHALSAKPNFIILKDRDNAGTTWWVYHSSLGATKYLDFGSSAAAVTSPAWNDVGPTSSQITIGANPLSNTGNKIIYMWANLHGLQSFGTYTGNGSANGPFIQLGFQPKIFIYKKINASGAWQIADSSRSLFNPAKVLLNLDLIVAEGTSAGYELDLLSNGVKIRGNGSSINSSGDTFIYMAWAEFPFAGSSSSQNTAR